MVPVWARQGCKEVRRWEEEVVSGHKGCSPSAVGTGYFIEYLDSKGRKQQAMMRVEWDYMWPGCDYEGSNNT